MTVPDNRIKIPYKARKWAKELHNTGKKLCILIIHRQGGKTTACLHHLMKDALEHPGTRYAYIAPYYRQAKNVAWATLKKISRPIPDVGSNEVDLKVTYPNGATIQLYGADNPDSLRGITLNGVVFDEYSQHPGNIFTEIIAPTLSTTNGYAIWIGTPKGKNQLYNLFQTALKDPGSWLSVFRTIEDTINEEEGPTVENLKKYLTQQKRLVEQGVITEDELRQELYCSFDASIKGAYYSREIEKARAEVRVCPVPYDAGKMVYTVWDLGMADAMAIGFFQKNDAGQLRMIDYYENTGQALVHYVNVLKQKGYSYGQHFAPHDIQQRELLTGVSRLSMARELGVPFNVVPNISIADGINAGRLLFQRAIFDATKCEEFLDKLARYHKVWDSKRGMFRDTPNHDATSHAADVWRYTALVEDQFATLTTENQDFDLYSQDYA